MEKSKTSFFLLSGSVNRVEALVQEFFQTKKIEMLISTFFSIKTAAPKLMTYEETGFCLLLHKTELKSLGEEIFFSVN